ncbi:outer membrane lipoprotein chaperone LolA [Castellaniella sp. GW247-6E4]|uniref:outer membrane lipoprotein chaperone LolA n=1 Tax=Castellaniella sp. GW247-6E4 TaxID=3140380 RepID=UPI003315E33B
MTIKTWLSGLVLACLPVMVLAADARTQLRDFIADVHTATGRFEQVMAGGQGAGRTQSGDFSFQRPGKFRWEVRKPYEQLIVSDGRSVYQYDPDLGQVIRRSARQAIGASPAALLFGSGALEDSFDLQAQPDRDGLQWLRALPKGGDAGFVHVDIGFADGLPRRLELLDAFGQTSHIGLEDIHANPTLPADRFRFQTPPGVDLVEMN